MSIPDKNAIKISNDLVKIPSNVCNIYELIKFCLKNSSI